MTNGFRHKHIYWRWQSNSDAKNWFAIKHQSSKCWIFDKKYGKNGPKIWRDRQPGKLIIVSHKTKLKYTYAIELFARACKHKLNEKFFARNFYLIPHIRRKKEKIYQIYGYQTILNKYKLNYDVINYISNFLEYRLVNIEKYLN